MNDGTRLNKFLASCAVGSRRDCDALIAAGRVEINGQRCTQLATRVTPADFVKVDGRRVTPKATTIIALHKPRGFVCSRDDEMGRETIYDLLPPSLHNLHHVGRLDRDSEGLLILTNDGDLSQRLMHPSQSVEKEYLVTANQAFENAHLDQFLSGIYTPEGKLRAKAIERLSPRRIKVILDHGAKRQIRVMFEAMGYTVSKLLRVRIGQLWLGDLAPGQHAALSPLEVAMLLGKPASAQAPKKTTRTKNQISRKADNPNKKTFQNPPVRRGTPPAGKTASRPPQDRAAGPPKTRQGPPPTRVKRAASADPNTPPPSTPRGRRQRQAAPPARGRSTPPQKNRR